MPETISEVIPTECTEVVLHVWDYLDGQLNLDATTALQAHIAVCPQCYEYQLFQESYLNAVAALRGRSAAPWRIKARVFASLAAEGLATR